MSKKVIDQRFGRLGFFGRESDGFEVFDPEPGRPFGVDAFLLFLSPGVVVVPPSFLFELPSTESEFELVPATLLATSRVVSAFFRFVLLLAFGFLGFSVIISSIFSVSSSSVFFRD